MSSRYWLSIPGRADPLEVSEQELVDRKARGDLPVGTLFAPLGEQKWLPLDQLKAERAIGNDDEPSPPSSSATGVELFDDAPAFAPTIAGESAPVRDEREHAATVAGPAAPSVSKPRRNVGKLVAVGAAAAVLLAGSIAGVLWWRNGYPRGAVLEHIPDDCKQLLYVDFAAIDALPAMSGVIDKRDRRLADWAEDADNEDQFRVSKDADSRGRSATLRTLTGAGIRAFGEVREVARCMLKGDDGVEYVRAIGGTFRGHDFLRTLREAMLRRDRKAREDKLTLDEIEGHPALMLDEGQVIVMATAQVALIGKKKTVTKLLPTKSMARTYAIGDGDLVVRRDEGDPPTDRRTRREGSAIVFRRLLVANKSDEAEQKLRADIKRTSSKLRQRSTLDPWTDALDGADVTKEGDGARMTVRWSNKDAGIVLRTLAEADLRELSKEREAIESADALALVWFALTPGVDQFDLRVGPWSSPP
jgi:hypothetical protein